MSLEAEDRVLPPVPVLAGHTNVACLAMSGRLLVFPLDEVKLQPNGGRGLTLMNVDPKDPLVSVATLTSDTADTLNSGWKEIGSTASLVTAFTLRYSPNKSFQWNGAKQHPGRTRSVTTAGRTARPRRDAISTLSPSTMDRLDASEGWISKNGPGLRRFSLSTLPVLVSVCHWCCTRPVLSVNGNSSSDSSAKKASTNALTERRY